MGIIWPGNTYRYQCPECLAEREINSVPEHHADAAAPWCDVCCAPVKMIRMTDYKP